MGTKKFSTRRRDNNVSVYFDEKVREQIEELSKEYPGIKSHSRIIETLAKYGLEQIEKNKEAKLAFEKRLISDV